jgi:hypothetical protein
MVTARWIASVFTLLPACLLAQQPGAEVKRMRVVRTDTPPVIDGRLDDAVWSTAGIVEDLHQILPTEYAEPSERTTIYLLYDQENLYIGARMWDDEPDEVTAQILRQGELLGNEDVFAVLLSPFNDKRSGYMFSVNPNGVRVEALFQDVSRFLWDWDGIWEARSSVDGDGWVAELAVPLRSLSFDPNGDTWGINFYRRVARKQETIGWVTRNRSWNPSTSGEVEGFSELQQGVGLDVVPSLSLRKLKQYSPSGSDSEVEPSLDVFYKPTPGLTGVLTINTDFSATEVDDRQVNLTRFSLFFPEKRAFFLQDADIFQFGRIGAFPGPDNNNARPFFSRTIGLSGSLEPVNIIGGVKLSGRVDPWNLGVLAVRQDAFENVEATNLFVGRVTANVLQESLLGMIVTNGDPDSNLDNSLYGFDFLYFNTRLQSGRSIEGDVWYEQSDTPGLNGDDKAFGISASSNAQDKFDGFVSFKVVEENFRPALGFINRLGIRNLEAGLEYTYRPEDRFLRAIQPRLGFDRFERIADGSVESQTISVQPFSLENHTGDYLQLTFFNNREGLIEPFEISDGVIIPIGDYEFNRYSMQLNTGGQRKWSGGLGYSAGDFFDGESVGVAPYFNWRPSAHFRLNVEYRVDDIDLPQGSFVTRLTRLRTDIVFSSRLSWVNLFQWDNVSNLLGINSRFHWIPQAGRDIFLVLNHNMRDIDENRTFRSESADLTLKASYTFRF